MKGAKNIEIKERTKENITLLNENSFQVSIGQIHIHNFLSMVQVKFDPIRTKHLCFTPIHVPYLTQSMEYL